MTNSEVVAAPSAPATVGHPAVCPPGRYLTFSVGGEVYAVHISEIAEIIAFRTLTVVPMMPDYIRGVLNLRGRVLPVVDLSARFGHDSSLVARRTSVLVVETSSLAESNSALAIQGIGIMVDIVNNVVQFTAEDLKSPPAFGAGVQSDFISGMARTDGDFTIVLNLDKVLDFHAVSRSIVAAAAEHGDLGSTAA